MTIRVVPKKSLQRSYLLSVSRREPGRHRATAKRPSVAAEGGSQFTRFQGDMSGNKNRNRTIQAPAHRRLRQLDSPLRGSPVRPAYVLRRQA